MKQFQHKKIVLFSSLCFLFTCAIAEKSFAACDDIAGYVNSQQWGTHRCFNQPVLNAVLTCIQKSSDTEAVSCSNALWNQYSASDVMAQQAAALSTAVLYRGSDYIQHITSKGLNPQWFTNKEPITRYGGNNVYDDEKIWDVLFAKGMTLTPYEIESGASWAGGRGNVRILQKFLALPGLTRGQLSNILFFIGNYPSTTFGYGSDLNARRAPQNIASVRKTMMEMVLAKGGNPSDVVAHAEQHLGTKIIYIPLTAAQKLVHWGQPHPLSYALLPDKSNEAYVAVNENNLDRLIEMYVEGYDFTQTPTYGFLDSLLHFAVKNADITVIDFLLTAGIPSDSISVFASENILTAAAKRSVYNQEIIDYVADLTPDINYINSMGFTIFETDRGFSALGIAVCKGDAPLTRHLLSRGANPSALGTACRNTLSSVLATPVSVAVEVPKNTAPTVNAGADRTHRLSITNRFSVKASASDPDGSISSYQWNIVSTPSGVNSSSLTVVGSSSDTVTVSNLSAVGSYVLRVTVKDNFNGTNGPGTASDDITITVTR